MDLDARVKRLYGWLEIQDTDGEHEQTLRELIDSWNKLQADNARLRHIFSLQALDDVE